MDVKFDRNLVKNLKLISAGIETLLAIPYIGGYFAFHLAGFPILIIFALHIFTLFLSHRTGSPKVGSIAGVIIYIMTLFPLVTFVGRFMHLVTAILLWIDFSNMNDEVEIKSENEFDTKDDSQIDKK